MGEINFQSDRQLIQHTTNTVSREEHNIVMQGKCITIQTKNERNSESVRKSSYIFESKATTYNVIVLCAMRWFAV